MIISINAEKASVKTQYPFMITNTQKTRKRRELSQPHKGHVRETTASTILYSLVKY